MRLTLIYAVLFLGCSCSFEKTNKFSDPNLIQIADFQDKRQTDSLYQFLHSENPTYRREAALAFASLQDTMASTALGTILLEDDDAEVRRVAAFALGQTGGFLSVNSLIPGASDKNAKVVREVLEALGKTINKKDIETLTEYKANDSLTQEGLAWGFYHLGLRGLADSLVVNRCRELLTSVYSDQTRLGAAHFFNRSPMLPVQNYAIELIRTATEDPNVYVRMAAASGLRKINSTESLEALMKIISTDKDYRVRCNGVRALSAFSFDKSQGALLTALSDENVNVEIAASELIQNKATVSYQKEILEKARTIKNWRVQAELYKTALALGSTQELITEVESIYITSKNDYQKSWLLGSLSNAVQTFPFIRDKLVNAKILVIKSSAAQALVDINHHKDFSPTLKTDFISIYKQALADGDPGVIVSIASALSDSTLDYKSTIKDFNFLYEAKMKLSLPKDIEALQPLEEAIAYFEGKPKPPAPKNEFNHPINWELVKTIPGDQKVLIKTVKGDIVMRLFIEEAPGSAINFIELCNQKYFNGKFFHRVVPNFVAQAGCNRGDGYGSEAYSIRSEFSGRRYVEGSVGMASAGKDTEGTQWFITHSPTPHLDGKYTIFAKVISGMEVVHQIEVGDQILTLSIMDKYLSQEVLR
jgi:cyclophilin family peptidyl-prolyl cis-trans isomerase/HEAT repeat protein